MGGAEMTEHQKTAIQEAAHANFKNKQCGFDEESCQEYSDAMHDFTAGANEVITNPSKYGLSDDPYKDLILVEIIDDLKEQNQRYKEALERTATVTVDDIAYKLAQQALQREKGYSHD